MLRFHLEEIGFINKYQSGISRATSTDDHRFRLSQSIMESFNRREHVVAAFLDVDNVSVADDHMGSDHFPIQISLDKALKRNTPLTEPRY